MEMFIVHGGRPLCGRVTVSGSKNAALPIMAAALMAEGQTRLHNVPRLQDIATMSDLLRSLGLRVESSRNKNAMTLEVCQEIPHVAEYELVRRMRAGVCVLGPLLAKRGRAIVSLPGGCHIGNRPIDLHLNGLRALGADIRVERGYVIAEAKRLTGTAVDLLGPFGSTVTGTNNIMSAATLARGTTVIHSAAREPEVVDLGEFLIAMGARISGLGTSTLTIDGVDRLHAAEYTVIPDRIEAATLMIAVGITGGEATIQNLRPDHLTAVISKLRETGLEIDVSGQRSTVGGQRSEVGGRRSELTPYPLPPTQHASPPLGTGTELTVIAPRTLQAVHAVALPYPGLPTDVQAQLMALLSVAEGESVITERVFPDRFLHAAELNRMGAKIRREGATAVISGVQRLSSATVMASDLRASAALVLAALVAEGTTAIKRIYHLDRGYESLEQKLTDMGADVRRLKDIPENLPSAHAA